MRKYFLGIDEEFKINDINFKRYYKLSELLDMGISFINHESPENLDEDYCCTPDINYSEVINFPSLDLLIMDFFTPPTYSSKNYYSIEEINERLEVLMDGEYYAICCYGKDKYKFVKDDDILNTLDDCLDSIISDSDRYTEPSEDDKNVVTDLLNDIKTAFGKNKNGRVVFVFSGGVVDEREVKVRKGKISFSEDRNSSNFEGLIQHIFTHSPVVVTFKIETKSKHKNNNFFEVYSFLLGISRDGRYIYNNIDSDTIKDSYCKSGTEGIEYDIYCDLSGNRIMGYDIV